MDHDIVAKFLEAMGPDPYDGLRIGDCTGYWWEDECWYTEEEKDDMAASAYWHKYLVPRPKRIDQKKVEWVIGGTMT